MIKNILLAAMVLAATACAPASHWEKQGGTQDEFNMAAGQCRAQAYSVPLAGPNQVAIVYGSCMQGKGYYLVKD